MRSKYFILCLLILFVARNGILRAQTPPDPTAEQLMQMMRSQPAMDISAPVTATAAFDPPLIQPGEKAVYRVTFNATAVSVNWPEKIPAPPGLKIHLNASGQTMLPVGAGFQNFATFDYDVRADAQGHFVMPAFAVQIYGKQVVVPEAELDVRENLPATHELLRQLVVEPTATNVYIGQIFDVSVRLDATTGLIEGVSDVQFNGGGFVAGKNTARQTVRMTGENGRRVMSYFYEASLTPLAVGKLNLSAQGFTARMQPGGETQILLDSEPVAINVRPLPTENELPGFNGLVGRYLCDPPNLTTNVLVAGEPVELTVIIRGRENLKRVVPPAPPHAEGWQIFPAERSGIMADANGPGLKFKYTLIPLTEKISATPAIPFSCFDPESESYLDLTIQSLPVTIIAGSTTINNDAALISADNSNDSETKIRLSKLAASSGWTTGGLVPWQSRGWFLPAQIFLALAFGGLWFCDRRRRWLEQHPEIVRRRAAKRALRREMRLLDGATSKKNSAEFIRRAINALQTVCAPHYPAAPRALVCGDVLEILAPAERAGKSGDTVRRFFAAHDAAAFADLARAENDLFAEESALKETLKILEARL